MPQEAVLSPVLFNIYVNEFSCAIAHSSIFHYADDTVLVSKHIHYFTAVEHLQSDCPRVMDWLTKNFIEVNVEKTNLMCFRSP